MEYHLSHWHFNMPSKNYPLHCFSSCPSRSCYNVLTVLERYLKSIAVGAYSCNNTLLKFPFEIDSKLWVCLQQLKGMRGWEGVYPFSTYFMNALALTIKCPFFTENKIRKLWRKDLLQKVNLILHLFILLRFK